MPNICTMLNVFARLSCGIPMLKCVDNFYYLPFYSTSEKEDKEKSEFVLLEKKPFGRFYKLRRFVTDSKYLAVDVLTSRTFFYSFLWFFFYVTTSRNVYISNVSVCIISYVSICITNDANTIGNISFSC